LRKEGGTLFCGNPLKQKSRRKSWLQTLVKNDSWVVVDEGCAEVILKGNASLLPIGIRKVHGSFNRGNIISIKFKSRTLAVGISEFNAREMDLVKGKKSAEIAQIIKDAHSQVAIHKDNLVLK